MQKTSNSATVILTFHIFKWQKKIVPAMFFSSGAY